MPLPGLLAALDARAAASRLAAPAETGALIDIVSRCHERHRAELPGLIARAAELEAAAPCGLADLLDALRAGLEEHMPHPLALMRAEHDDNAEFLLRAEHLTRGFRPPADAGPAWERLCAELSRFADDLVAHVDLEERALFPRFEASDFDCARQT